MELDPAWERRRHPDPDPTWEEVFDLDFWAPDGSVAGYIRLALRPHQGHASYWACLVGDGRPLVSVLEPDAPLPGAPTLEFRTSGLWADIIPQTPFSHMTVGLEAFGLAFDEPAEVFGRGWGAREALGFDMEWEDELGPHIAGSDPSGLQVPSRVHGEILVGREQIDFDGWGSRRHRWGPAHHDRPMVVATGRLDDGTWFHGDTGVPAAGYVGDPSAVAETVPSVARAGDDLVQTARLRVGDHYLAATPRLHAPAVDEVPVGRHRVRRALVDWTTGDGRAGIGWIEDRSVD